MHKTIYIDVDEEITSIIDRMRNANSSEIVISVPKRALLIQSILNLKILKKEAERMGITVVIVTQDKLGRLLVEKAGIELAQNVEEGYQEMPEEILPSYENISGSGGAKDVIRQKESMQNRIESIGSDNYYEKGVPKSPSISERLDRWPAKEEGREKITNQELVGGLGKEKGDLGEKKKFIGIDSTVPVPVSSLNLQASPKENSSPAKNEIRTYPNSDDLHQENQNKKREQFVQQPMMPDKKVENFFRHVEQEKSDVDTHGEMGKGKGVKVLALYLILAVAVLAISYFLIPKAKVILHVQSAPSKVIEDEIQVDSNFSQIDYEEGIIPGKIVTASSEVSKNFQASGSKSVSNQKSHGTITIYNEFGPDSQPLVATTRFESEDGKIFRLKKGITVPGTTKVGDEIKPGVIEAEVEADKAGPEYDIGPSKFTIPGFKSSGTKYEKIYGKSTKAMTGGGSSSSDTKALTQEDVDSAKSTVVSEVKEAAKNKLKQEVGAGMIFLDDAASFDEATFKLSNSPGDVVENFELRAEVKVTAVIFSEADMKNIMAKIITKSGDLKVNIDGSSMLVEYKAVRPDVQMGKLIVSVSASNKPVVNLDEKKIKKDLLGKNNKAIEEYFKNYPDVIKIDVNYWPSFLNQRIPFWEKRVEIEVRNDAN
jgi:hypothetical protein